MVFKIRQRLILVPSLATGRSFRKTSLIDIHLIRILEIKSDVKNLTHKKFHPYIT
jgi:hypothetical protein